MFKQIFAAILPSLLWLNAASAEAAAAPYNWGTETAAYTNTPEFAASKAICRRIGPPKPPARDQPLASELKALKGCSSESLYYAPGGRPNYVKARLCAFTDIARGDDKVFGGSTILMQIYANGLGVPRDTDLATAYACGIDDAPAESDGRVLHIQSLRTKPGRLDYCDDITSGLAEGFCQSRASERTALDRNAKLKALGSRLPPNARALYPSMMKAFDAFVAAHGDGEVDLSGTARAALVIQEQDNVRDQFERDLDRLTTGRWPKDAAATTADQQLNASYRRALAWTGGKDNFTKVKPDAIRTAQRAWLAFRDAFIPFALAAAPSADKEALLARITRLRTAQLDQLSG